MELAPAVSWSHLRVWKEGLRDEEQIHREGGGSRTIFLLPLLPLPVCRWEKEDPREETDPPGDPQPQVEEAWVPEHGCGVVHRADLPLDYVQREKCAMPLKFLGPFFIAAGASASRPSFGVPGPPDLKGCTSGSQEPGSCVVTPFADLMLPLLVLKGKDL